MTIHNLIILTSVLLFSGCISGVKKVKYEPLIEINSSLVTVDNVEVFQTKKPLKSYQEIGVLSYRAGTAEKYIDVISYFRQKAASLGADGVIIMGTSSGPSIVTGNALATMTDYRAVAIRYK